MRTTIDIDPHLLSEAIDVTGARTKREVVELSLRELVRRKRLEDLAAAIGTRDFLDMDSAGLERLRADE